MNSFLSQDSPRVLCARQSKHLPDFAKLFYMMTLERFSHCSGGQIQRAKPVLLPPKTEITTYQESFLIFHMPRSNNSLLLFTQVLNSISAYVGMISSGLKPNQAFR